MIYHTLHTMSINRCNRMMFEEDVRLIARIPVPKLACVVKHDEFMDQLKEIFNEGNITEVLDNNIMRMNLIETINNLTRIARGFEYLAMVNDAPKVIQLRDKLSAKYRNHFFDYPNKDTIQDIIRAEIKKLTYKEKMFRPKIKEGEQDQHKNEGLEDILNSIQILLPELGYIDRKMPVYSLKALHKNAMQKAEQMKNAK